MSVRKTKAINGKYSQKCLTQYHMIDQNTVVVLVMRVSAKGAVRIGVRVG